MRYLRYIILLIFLLFLTLTVYADGANPLIYQYTNPYTTVAFSEALDVSAEHQQEIADLLSGNYPITIIDPNNAIPQNILCSLFGHKLSTTTVTVTHHKDLVHDPRCLMEVYHVTACSRCDYTDPVLTNSFHISCCPED